MGSIEIEGKLVSIGEKFQCEDCNSWTDTHAAVGRASGKHHLFEPIKSQKISFKNFVCEPCFLKKNPNNEKKKVFPPLSLKSFTWNRWIK